jgi:nucleoside-diphosphate-sugar epimerase
MKIFLTGGTGFIGRPLTQRLLERGWEVIALVRNPESNESKEIKSLGAHLIQGNVTNKESMRAGMQGADVVIHNAGWYEFGICKQDHEKMFRINVEGTQNTLDLAVELRIPRIIHTSSILAYGRTGDIVVDESYVRQFPPLTYYEETKMKAHEIATSLQKQGAPIIITCPAGVIGPGDHSATGYLVRMYVRHCLPPILWTPNGKLAHVYVDDAAEGIARCVEYGKIGEVYLLSNGNQTHREMSEDWKKCDGGCKKTWFWLPNSIAFFLNRVAEPIERLLGFPIVFCKEFILTAKDNWQFSAAKAERELHMQFRSLEQAWCDTIEGERILARKKKESKLKQ